MRVVVCYEDGRLFHVVYSGVVELMPLAHIRCGSVLLAEAKFANGDAAQELGAMASDGERRAVGRGAEEERRKDVMGKIVKRMQHGTVAGAMCRWMENTKEQKGMRAKSEKVLARWRNKSSALCLDAWHEHTVEEGRKRHVMQRVLARMANKAVLVGFEMWTANVLWAREERAEEERRRDVMSKIVKMLR